MGNGHEAIYFVLSTEDIHSHSKYKEEEIENILDKISDIRSSSDKDTSSEDLSKENGFEEGKSDAF